MRNERDSSVSENIEFLSEDRHEMDAENLNEHKQEEPKDYDPPELPHKVVEQEGDEECIHRPHNEVRDSPGRVFNFSCILGQHIHYEAYIVLGEDIVTKMSNFLIE